MKRPDVLMTYNTDFGREAPEIVERLADLPIDKRPQIACFQEFPEPFVNHYAIKLGQIGYQLRFASAIEKHGKVFGQLTAVGLKGKIIDSKVEDFGFNNWEKIYPGIKGRSGRRSALVTKIQTANDRLLQVVNIHQPLIASDEERIRNIRQVEQGLDPEVATIIAGDQNFSSFGRLWNKNWLIDQMEELGFRDSGNMEPTFFWNGLRWKVDYVSLRDESTQHLTLQNPRVVKLKLSDHEPLFVEIH